MRVRASLARGVGLRYAREMGAMVRCAACTAEISRAASACPKCGHPRAQSWGHVAALLAVGAVLVAVAGRFFGLW